MKAIMLMFDTLNRNWLPPYGCDWVHAPNFSRLAERSVTFSQYYVGSMPCMPARRDLHTGRYNFMHRSWGPLEPFDDSLPEILKESGVYTHLVTDHQHYWEDGGGTYHTRYNSYELVRGQEGDPCKGHVKNPIHPEMIRRSNDDPMVRQDWINRSYIEKEEDFPQAITFDKGMEFIRTNSNEDRWFLQLETFDPHEPFFAPEKYRQLYPHIYDGLFFDWPPYAKVTETAEQVSHLRYEYAALLSMCDAYLGKVLDLMDELNLWEDTMLIVNTDHGYLLGEHDEWAKCVQPFYEEISHAPMFIWDPRSGVQGERRDGLVQMIDIAPTLLDYFGVHIPTDMLGKPLGALIAHGEPIRDAALFGIHGGHVNITDGRYVYMRGPAGVNNEPLFNYTLMPTHMRSRFKPSELQDIQLSAPWNFTKGVSVLKIPGTGATSSHITDTMLFDLQHDPKQLNPYRDAVVEQRLSKRMIEIMEQSDAPLEQYERLGLR